MKISHVEVIRLSIPFASNRAPALSGERAWNAASAALTQMETLLIRVVTDSGRQGWGEGFGHLSNAVTAQALQDLVIPYFLDKTVPTSREALATLVEGAEKALHAFGGNGPVRFALSAMDIALWDLLGQHHEQPLWQLLGATRQHITCYASLVSYNNQPDEVARQVKRAWQAGFRSLKLHETHVEAIAAARAALPAEARLMVDVNCPWTPEEACHRARELKTLNLAWLEEPVWPPEDAAGLARVRRAGTPIAAGENASGAEGFAALFNQQAVDVAQPSVAKVGGISAVLRITEQARRHQVNVIPHCFYYGAGLLATAHLVAALPDDVQLERPFIHFSARLHPQLDLSPQFSLPDIPGLGFEPDAAVMKEHTLYHRRVDAEGVHHV
ncbi:mandelate racemase/muconate lactonizing enzyme family protein [Erwinia sp. ErVv1]|uniref:mandelate racemase/muconate lactonizing enzyme family protein n=1 Tax=Erwinia sp. ErVv1 TaxID=1603299 RepID=UPI00082D7597|nr:mandelate racemase/muconate lactonizing enzyme family protein [Erwinia sp. ErVv1]